MPGPPAVVLIPSGRLVTSPLPPSARAAVSFHTEPPQPERSMVVPHQGPEGPRKPTKPKGPRKPKEPKPSARAADRSVRLPVPSSTAPLRVVNHDAAGIDVHSDMHMVCVPADRDAEPV